MTDEPRLDTDLAILSTTRPTLDEVAALVRYERPPAREDATALASSALWYAEQGWPVFPLVPGDKVPLTKHGLKDASTDPQQIESWWKRQPRANIGLPTGLAFDVIDVDATSGGFLSFAEWIGDLRAAGYPAPDVKAVAFTGRNGRHLLLPATGRGNAAGLRPGIDYRGLGGYIVAPPSRLDNGGAYTWVVRPRVELFTRVAA